MGYIPQKAVLFSGTIRSNMEFGESSQGKLEDEAIWKALELAQAKEFVAAKEKGLDTEVAQGRKQLLWRTTSTFGHCACPCTQARDPHL